MEESVTRSPGAGVLVPICPRLVTGLRSVHPILAEEAGRGRGWLRWPLASASCFSRCFLPSCHHRMLDY